MISSLFAKFSQLRGLIIKVRESYVMVNGSRKYKFVLETSLTDDSEEYDEVIENRYHASVSLANSNTDDFHYHGGR